MKKVSIILSSYNGHEYIRELLDSVMNLDYPDYRLFICDDGSADDTCEIAAEYQERFPEKVIFSRNDKNMGSTLSFLSNLKRIASEYPADYFMFCDQDDVWLIDKINVSLKAIKKIERRKGSFRPALVFNDALIVNDNLEYISRSFYKTNRLKVHKHDFAHMLMENKCIGCTIMMNKALVSLIGETGPAIRYHDWWMALLASAFGTIKYVKSPTLLYRQHSDNQVGQESFGNYVKKRSSSAEDIKDRLQQTYRQAEYFEHIYSERLSRHKRKRLSSFNSIRTSGFFKRRFIIIKNRFFKSGFARNIGLLFYV